MKLVLALLAVSLYVLTQSSVVESKKIACKTSAIQCGNRCQGMCRSPFQLTAFNKRQPKKSRNKNKSKKKPRRKPKKKPKRKPKKKPTKKPRKKPTKKPKKKPRKKPTRTPTKKNQRKPTKKPRKKPTKKPRKKPTKKPKKKPTKKPRKKPTKKPRKKPTKKRTKKPRKKPTKKPRKKPITKPRKKPTKKPRKKPTKKPRKKATKKPKKKSTKKKRRKNRSVLNILKRPSEINTRIKRGKTKSKPKPKSGGVSKKGKKPIKTPLGSTLFRTLRPDENPANGITAKDPSAQKSIQSHVGCGCRPGYQSQYISTTKEYNVAVHYGRRNTIVAIDVGKAQRAGCRIDDISDGSGLRGLAANFARASKEVLISGCTIPANAVTVRRQGS